MKDYDAFIGIDPGKNNAVTIISPRTPSIGKILIGRFFEPGGWVCPELLRGIEFAKNQLGILNAAVMVEEPMIFINRNDDPARAIANLENVARMNRMIGYLHGKLEELLPIDLSICTQAEWKKYAGNFIPGMKGDIRPDDYEARNKKELALVLQMQMGSTVECARGKIPGYKTLVRDWFKKQPQDQFRILRPELIGEIPSRFELTVDECASIGIAYFAKAHYTGH